ncbi:MAG: Riboflavin-binding protein RibY [Anaerolineales bacterium]|nr:Riboflavin-binding protein RibY [Anaerolineales bacterium]
MKYKTLTIFLLLSLILTACTTALAPTLPAPTSEPADRPTETQPPTSPPSVPPVTPTEGVPRSREVNPLTPVILSMGFVPNVQFAPFYVAVARGYFAKNGLTVEFDYGMENDLLQLVGTGKRQFVVGSGDQVILARSRGLPVVYVMNWYRRFPVVVFALDDLDWPADLVGKTVGLPGLFGASYIGWQALLNVTHIPADRVNVETIGFTQAEAVAAGKVDAAVGYAMNEPIRLRQEGYTPAVIEVADYIDLVANGLITNETTIAENPDLVQRVVGASLMGLRDTIANPDEAFEITLNYVPEAGEHREAQLAVLEKSIEYWKANQLGYSDRAAWETSRQFLRDIGLIEETTDVNEMFTNRFVDAVGLE